MSLRERWHGWMAFLDYYQQARRKKHGAGATSIRMAVFLGLCARSVVTRRPYLSPHHGNLRWLFAL